MISSPSPPNPPRSRPRQVNRPDGDGAEPATIKGARPGFAVRAPPQTDDARPGFAVGAPSQTNDAMPGFTVRAPAPTDRARPVSTRPHPPRVPDRDLRTRIKRAHPAAIYTAASGARIWQHPKHLYRARVANSDPRTRIKRG